MHHANELQTTLDALSPAMVAALGYRKADDTPGDMSMSAYDRVFGPVETDPTAEAAMTAYLWLDNLWNRADAIATVMGRNGIGPDAWKLRGLIAEVRSSAWDLKSAIESGDADRIADARSVLMAGVLADGSEV